ncbi:putative quinone oxidoreductase [Phaeomoniella chlamydospora]|uniref:Putative quinone oxidoreductase n=1 Tax=Phaeomoniella chlamydospora TaxID=158046 RepID=A0A0G2EVY8_PHACM|nr:putative quinone oxidoreductase [Phaeomoniella chlamydospora]
MSNPIPSTMRAIVAEKAGGPEVLKFDPSHPVPTLKANEILVKNKIAGINYIDTYFRSGTYPSPKPEILGRETVGTIAAIGDSVPSSWGLKPGDRVVWTSGTGGYAEYTAVPSAKVIKIPNESVTDEAAAGGFLMGLTALSILSEAHEVKKGETILIHAAAGGTGKLMVQVAKTKGARVIGTAGGPEKCKLAKHNGADEVVDYNTASQDEWVKQILDLTNGEGVNAVFDGVGKSTWDASLDVVKRKGTVAFFGAASGPVPDIPVK